MSGEGHLAARPLIEAPLLFQVGCGGARRQRGGKAFILCPKCDAPAFIRTSEWVTVTVKDIYAHCTNTGCGHIFVMQLAFVHSLAPGLIDRPDLDLAVCPRDRVPHILPQSRDGPDEDQLGMFESG